MKCPVAACNYHSTEDNVQRHYNEHHTHHRGKRRSSNLNIHPFTEIEAFRGFARSYRHRKEKSNIITAQSYFKKYRHQIHKLFKIAKKANQRLKCQFTLAVIFSRGEKGNVDYETITRYENSSLQIMHTLSQFDEILDDAISEIVHYIETFEQFGSGWTLLKVLGCDIRIGRVPHLGAGCHVKVPADVVKKRCLVNVKNLDNECFKWAFLSVAHYKDVHAHRYRVSQYKKYAELYDFSGVNYPAEVKDIDQFNHNNETKKLCVNVFGLEPNDNGTHNAVLIKMAKNANREDFRKINILIVNDESECNQHYVGIVDISRLFGKQNKHRHEFCYNCVNLVTKKSFKSHQKICLRFKNQEIRMPESDFKGSDEWNEKLYIQFDAEQKLLKHEFAIYADFEAICKKLKQEFGGEIYDDDEDEHSKTTKISRHIPCGYAYCVITNGKLHKFRVNRGKNCVQDFFHDIQKEVKKIKDRYRNGLSMRPLTEDDEQEFQLSTSCSICKHEFKDTSIKVRDHCPFTGYYRGAAHSSCNAIFTLKTAKVPIIFHGFRNYDSHLLIQGFEKYGDRITVIPSNTEKYMSIICDDFVFLDSLMFLNSSLSTLVENLRQPDKNADEGKDFQSKFSILIENYGIKKAKILSRKGVYPYDYMSSFDKFNETSLPPLENFYNTLTEEYPSKQDYDYASMVFNKYCSDMGDYHDLYLGVDCLLLACVFEYFRNCMMDCFKLDPLHYFSLSQYSLDAALLKSGVKLEMLTDRDKYTFFEASLRGGISTVNTREAYAHNKYTEGDENIKDPTFIAYLDKVNLYGESFLHKLPTGDFEWMSEEQVNEITTADILNMDPNGEKGATFMVSLEYPVELHDRDNCLPLCPEKISVPFDSLSNYTKRILRQENMKYSPKIKKLIPHLGDRKEYVVHFRTLQFYLKKGMVLKKVHSAITYTQEAWMRDYVLFNAEKRKQAVNTFEKNLFKFLVNAVFGKSIENVRSRRSIKITNDDHLAARYMKSPYLKSFEILNDHLMIFEFHVRTVTLDKPVYTGVSVLDLSKLFLYEFHYKFKEFYDNRAKLLFSDTDSLCYVVHTNDLYRDFESFKHEMDFSDYPPDHFLYSLENKKKIGTMKDEGNSKIFTHFVGLAPKLYSLIGIDIHKNAAKGIKKSVVKKSLRHEHFVNCLHHQKTYMTESTMIRSYTHEVFSVKQKKVGLRCYDSKRYVLESGIDTLAYNHYLLDKVE